MKICIVYESKYGNGKKCVEYLQSIIKAKGHDVKTFSIRNIKPNLLPEADSYIFSSPTHIGSIPWKMKRFLKKIKPKEGVKYALMATCINPDTKAIQKMEEILSKKGMIKISETKIKVKGMKGPLEENYKEKLDAFAEEIFG
jgi:flavodoxin